MHVLHLCISVFMSYDCICPSLHYYKVSFHSHIRIDLIQRWMASIQLTEAGLRSLIADRAHAFFWDIWAWYATTINGTSEIRENKIPRTRDVQRKHDDRTLLYLQEEQKNWRKSHSWRSYLHTLLDLFLWNRIKQF